MVTCCEHNPCPGRPRWFLGRFLERPWRCNQCGQFWITDFTYLWGELDGYDWKPVQPDGKEYP